MNKLPVLLIPLLVSGCASHLNVYKDDEAEAKGGIPYYAPRLVTVEITTSYRPVPETDEANSKYCVGTKVEHEQRLLPAGERRYIVFRPALMGKSGYELGFTENGILTRISLNSDPTEAVGQAGGLLSTVLSHTLGAAAASKSSDAGVRMVSAEVAAQASDSEPAEKKRSLYCLVSQVTEQITASPTVSPTPQSSPNPSP